MGGVGGGRGAVTNDTAEGRATLHSKFLSPMELYG